MSQSIGQRLKQEREARYLTLEKASEETRIRRVFLQALEADDYSVMPSAAQGRGFLRNYAAYLDLNVDEMIAEIQRSTPPPAEVSGPLPQVNLAETELPPLTDPEEEKVPFWRRWLSPKAQSAVLESELPQSEPVDQAAAEEVSQSLESEEPAEEKEARPGLRSRIEGLFRARPKPAADPEPAPIIEPIPPKYVPTQPADVIFAQIGSQLRARREIISLTLDEVERHTKLRAAYLKALEEGAYHKLPSPVQTRGMLANYASFLDLNVDAVMLQFADGLQARRHEKYSEIPREQVQTEVKTSMPALRSFIAGDLIFGVAMIVMLTALAVWGVVRVLNPQTEAVNITPLPPGGLAATPLETATPISTFVPVGETLAAGDVTSTLDPLLPEAETATPGVPANVTVNLQAVERVFVRIAIDGNVSFEGRLSPGEMKVLEAENQVVVLTGNGAALRVTYNNTDLGLMGGVGEVITRVYLISGVVTPTATIAPTPTNTQPVTPTPTPSSTPTFTPTVTPAGG